MARLLVIAAMAVALHFAISARNDEFDHRVSALNAKIDALRQDIDRLERQVDAVVEAERRR